MATNLDTLIPTLRIKLGDTNPASYRYLDAWLSTALVSAVIALGRYWSDKYLLDADNNVYRNTNSQGYPYFEYTAPPVLQFKDQWIIVLMAAIQVKSGNLENLAWDLASWRDAELSFSNLESGRQKDGSLGRDWDELFYYIKPPMKRLMTSSRTDYTDAT